ncbi:MAG: FAD-dependent oxidoreductase [Bryobacterales bacterium]|nr:FAD-dependent oxidoreductase [Bryobacterales bacterium]
MRVVVIGAGFAGACAAFHFRQRGASVTVLEQAAHSGGMLRTYHLNGALAYEYGPRIVSVFRGTQNGLDFIRRFLDLEERDIYQGTQLRPGYEVIPFPVDRQSLMRIPEGETIRAEMARFAGSEPDESNFRTYLETSVGPTLTRLAFEGFNRKFWSRELEELPASWGKLRRLERIAEVGAYRLPSVAPHYYPKGGFNGLFDQLLNGVGIRYGSAVQRVESSPEGPVVHCNGAAIQADLVLATAPVDELLGYRFGALEWKGYRIETSVETQTTLGTAPDGIPFAWLYTPWPETPVCRTTDFGVIHQGRDRRGPGVVLREIPDANVRMYPVSWEEERFSQYLEASSQIPGLIPLGRLGLYKYVTMDSTFAMVERLLDVLPRYRQAAAEERLILLRRIRGDWSN